MSPRQSRCELNQPEKRRRRISAPCTIDQAIRRSCHRDGVRRERPGRQLPTQNRNLRARLQTVDAKGRVSSEQYHFRSKCSDSRDRSRRAPQLRRRFHRSDALDQKELVRCTRQRRGQQYFVFVSRQQHRARSNARRFSLPRNSCRVGHGDRECRATRSLRRNRTRAAGTRRRRAVESPRRRNRTTDRVCRTRKGERQITGRGRNVAKAACRRASKARDG